MKKERLLVGLMHFTADETSAKQLVVVSMVEDANSVGGSHYLFPKVTQIFK